jgi:hypothetical protein
MTVTLRHLIAVAVLTAGCEGATRPSPIVIPGPSVPNPMPSAAPYVWDTRDELAIWVENPVARGSLAIEGTGAEAFVRIGQPDREWVLRGPNLQPSATGIRSLLVRYRWRPDVSLSPAAPRNIRAEAHFQTTTPLQPYYYGQASAGADIQPATEWTEITFMLGEYTPPIDVSYCYVSSYGANRGVLEIDRIELVR